MATVRIPKSVQGEKRMLPRRTGQWLVEVLAEIDGELCEDAEILGVTRVNVSRALATAGVPENEIREMWLSQFAHKGAQERSALLAYYTDQST
jgi:hypothetical protein